MLRIDRRPPANGLLALLFVGALVAGWREARPAAAQEPTGLEAAAALEGALTFAIAQAEKSVVAIARVKHGERDEIGALDPRPDPFGVLRGVIAQPKPGDPDFVPNDYGTGVVVDRRGLILTNYHVLGEDSEYFVTTAERKVYAARIKAADPRSDLAVLQIDAQDLTPIRYGDTSKLRKGQITIALGNPYAIARDGEASASWGIISNFQRKAPPTPPDEDSALGSSRTTLAQFGTLLQTDAKLNLGTSGGALVNLKGEMIGLTTALAAVAGYEQAAGYAIPVDDTFRRVVETLKEGREVEYGFLGVTPVNLSKEQIRNGRHGARLDIVVRGTPAERFGLHADDIVTHVDGRPIYDADGLVLHVGKLPVEATVRLTVERGERAAPVDVRPTKDAVRGKKIFVDVRLTKYAVRGKKIFTVPLPSWRGLQVDYPRIERDFGERIDAGRIDPQGCVLVTEVAEGSPTWKEGLRPGMAISHVAGARVSSPRDFLAAVAGKTGPVSMHLVVPSDERPVRSIGPEPVEPAGD